MVKGSAVLSLTAYYLMSHITPLPQLSHANALAAKPNMPTFIWIILLLSTYQVALYLPTRYLSFHVDSLSALLHDISTGRKFQPTFTTFLGACDKPSTFSTKTAIIAQPTNTTLLSITRVLGTPPTTEKEPLTLF